MVKPISLRLRNAEIRARAEATLIRAGRADDVKRAHNARVMREARATVERAKEQKRLKAVAALAAHKAIVAVKAAYEAQHKLAEPVSESGGAGIIYKEYDNSALPPAAATAEGEQDWSRWEAWMTGHLANEREAVLNIVNEGVNKMLDQERASIDRDLADLRAENAELKGMIGTVLRLYAGETKTGDVVDLPDWRKRDAA